MADRGHELTDDILAKLEQDIADEYAIAVRDMRNKLTEYLEKDEAKRQIQEKLLNDGAITQQEYNEWCYRHMMMGNALSKDMTKTKEIALKISREKQPDVCALNVNYATYQIEHDGELDTGLSLYNHDAAAHLLEEQRQLMPGPSTKKAAEIAANEDMQWNYKKIQSAVLQGILQGESPYDVAKRLNTVGRMNYNDSVRYARTMTTNSQNAGRYQAFRRARDIGVDLTIEWQATLDGRTRHSHRMMHGQRRDVDEPFELDGVKIMWPGNDKVGSSDVPQSMIWNCRCTLLSWVKGFEGKTVKSSPKMGDMSFEEWQREKAPRTTENKKATEKPTKLPENFDDVRYGQRGNRYTDKYLRERGYTDDEIAEASRLLDAHTAGHEAQKEADAAIRKHIEQNDRIGQLYKDKAGLEEAAWKHDVKKQADATMAAYKQQVKDVLEYGYSKDELISMNLYPQKPDLAEPRFYRKGDLKGDVVAFTKNKEGAGMTYLTEGDEGYIGWDISFTLGDLKKLGYRPIAGIATSDVGMSGEAEVLFAKIKKAVVSSPTIEARNPVGKPSAVIGRGKLDKRQESILSALQKGNGRAILNKKGVSMRDLSALTAQEEVEFAMLTRKNERMVFMGTRMQVSAINDQSAAALAKEGWRLSGHTHAVGGLVPSNGDMQILNYFGQERSALYDPVGRSVVFYRKELP